MSRASLAILQQALAKRNFDLGELERLIAMNPMERIIDIRQEAQGLLEEMQSRNDYSLHDKEIKRLAKEEKEQFAIADKQTGSKLWDDKLRLTTEITEIKNDIFYMERRVA